MEWERALNQAVSMTQKQFEISRREFENEKCELLEAIQAKEDQIAQLQLKLSSKKTLFDVVQCESMQVSPFKHDDEAESSSVQQLESEDKEQLKQCAVFFDQSQKEKSRLTISVVECDPDYDPSPQMCQQSEDIDQTLMMFDNLPDLRTGSSMKQ